MSCRGVELDLAEVPQPKDKRAVATVGAVTWPPCCTAPAHGREKAVKVQHVRVRARACVCVCVTACVCRCAHACCALQPRPTPSARPKHPSSAGKHLHREAVPSKWRVYLHAAPGVGGQVPGELPGGRVVQLEGCARSRAERSVI